MNKILLILFVIFYRGDVVAQNNNITLQFEHYANGKKIVLVDSVYTNAFGEKYSISKLKYYVSNIGFTSKGKLEIDSTVYLIDAAKPNNIILANPNRQTVGLNFMLGIDSNLNYSGAQTGALDALNDMFWTWNNGYVFFKLEGKSTSSTADLQRIEYHIGGYKNPYKTQRYINLPLGKTPIAAIKTIVIKVNIDKLFSGTNKIQLAITPVVTTPGADAVLLADNFSEVFQLKK